MGNPAASLPLPPRLLQRGDGLRLHKNPPFPCQQAISVGIATSVQVQQIPTPRNPTDQAPVERATLSCHLG